MYQVLIYRGTGNLGDAIQTVALSRLLDGPLAGVYRDAAGRMARPGAPFVVNGWLGDAVPAAGGNCTFAGVHVGRRVEEHLGWFGSAAGPVGSRDPETDGLLRSRGLRTKMVGCATLTFERYAGPRRGRWAVDADEPGAERLTHVIPPDLPWPAQWEMAVARLQALRTAEVVYTSRLHAALPCLAFGTPVVLRRAWRAKAFQPARLSLLDELGFDFDRPVTADVSAAAERYLRFLSSALGGPVTAGEARMPEEGAAASAV